jgi:hypothetical protein
MSWQVSSTAISSFLSRVQPTHLLQVDPIGQLCYQNMVKRVSVQFVTSRPNTDRF